MNRNTKIQFVAIVILAVVALYVVLPIPNKPRIPGFAQAGIHLGIDLAGGAELRYKVLFPSGFQGDRKQITTQASDVLRRRLETRLLQEPKISTVGDNGIVIQLAGVDAEGLRDCKRLIGTLGKLELHAAASTELQDRYDRDGVVPDGYRVVRNPEGAPILMEDRPVIEGRHLLNAEPQEEPAAGGLRWFTSFDLDAEGAERFDEAAERLYRQRPRGRIVILLDGELKSAPVVESPSFHGRGRISGAKNQKEARDLSTILRSGSLPVPIGSE